ncbi:MAG: hypothetical protein KAX49_11810 [Halanaerobiales bacterium]|nr:hypothetical protein [Halanaerobiales bacterium]
MKKIIGIKCKDKFFISEFKPDSYNKYISPVDLIINGEKQKQSFHPGWCIVNKEPESLQRLIKQSNINHRYELIDKTMESKKIPSTIEYIDGELVWNTKYAIYQSLYKLVSDKQPDVLEDIEFEYETIMEVKEIKEYQGFAYDIQKTQWEKDGLREVKEGEVQHQLIDEIMFPDILLPLRPCSLTSKQSFDVVRQYVKQHINYEVAVITSDFNFCFTIKKKIPLSEPEEYSINVNENWVGRKRKPKYETRYKRFREIECFNMSPEAYGDYKVIEGFRGGDREDLKNNIDDYCKKLITFINEPVKDCPQCKGRGVISIETFN